MLVIPAVDLRGGRCVRLIRGDFERETIYDDDPVSVARHWLSLGASWIHVVDLDGARAGRPEQLDLVSRIVGAGGNIELGGGLRQLEDLRAALAVGVRRIIIGTAAVENDLILRQAVREFGSESVILGVDARQGKVAIRGWSAVGEIDARDIVRNARESGITRVIYTDIDRDGTLTSPNFSAVSEIAALGVGVIASGGVSSVGDLRRLSSIPGVEAAIVGKALYEQSVRIHHPADWWVSPVDEGPNAEENDGNQE